MLLRALEMLARRRRRPGSHPVWSAFALAAFLLRLYKQRSHRDEVTLREVLEPGETLMISHTTQPRG